MSYPVGSSQSGGSGGGGGESSFVLSETEVNLGTTPRRAGRFEISSTGLTPGKAVFVLQASGPYAGKGTFLDESEMDTVSVTAKVLNSSTIQCFWRSNTIVRGNFKFNYIVGI